jgi:hypothetical protein
MVALSYVVNGKDPKVQVWKDCENTGICHQEKRKSVVTSFVGAE